VNAPPRIEELGDPGGTPGWDAFVRAHPLGATYHLAAWSRIVSGAYGSRPRYLAARGPDGGLVGVMPLFRHRGLISGPRLSSIPVARVAGPLAADEATAAALVRAACAMAAGDGVRQLVVRSLVDGLHREVDGLSVATDQPTWVVPLEDDAAGMRTRLRRSSKNVHRGIQRAERSGVTVRVGVSDADVRAFHQVYLTTMRKHGALARSLRQLLLERRELGPEFRLLLAVENDRVLAGAVFHRFGDTVELLYNGSDPDRLDVRPNHALYWHAIGWAISLGCHRFDMGGALPGTSLAEFKTQWGAEPVAIRRYTFVPGQPAAPEEVAPPPGIHIGGRRAMVARVYERTPLPLVRLVGTAAYRFA